MKKILSLFILITLTTSAWALNTITPPSPPASTSSDSITDEKASQGSGDAAPASSRPTAVPKFSLPDVVITGENEMTISAKRLTQKENDVTLGAQNLSTLERSSDDLPGLDKTITALSTQESGPPKDTTLILHGGGGLPGTYGGWGLYGQDLRDVLCTLSGYYSTWAGQATGIGFDGDRKYRFGGNVSIFPILGVNPVPFSLTLSAYYGQVDADLPYQNPVSGIENHDCWDLKSALDWKLSDIWHAQATINSQITSLYYWNTLLSISQTKEYNGILKIYANDLDSFWNLFSFELGEHRGVFTSNNPFPLPGVITDFNLGWVSVRSEFDFTDNLILSAELEGQAGSIWGLDTKFFPAFDLSWRALDNTQVVAAWRTARKVDNFNQAFMNTEHISPSLGLPGPTETTSEFEGKITQRVTETLVLSGSASTAQLVNYHQWTDINPVIPAFIYKYSSIPLAQMTHLGAGAQWNFMKDWKLSGDYLWTQATNNSGLNFTQLPINQGTVALSYGNEELEAKLGVLIADSRQGSDTTTITLPAYATLNLGAAYHFTKTFSLWLTGDNLFGQSYQIQPGYLEPQYHVRGGVEIIF